MTGYAGKIDEYEPVKPGIMTPLAPRMDLMKP